MALFISIFIAIVCLFFTAFFWGQYRANKKMPGFVQKHINPETKTFNVDTFNKEAKMNLENFGLPIILLMYFAVMGALMFCGYFGNWRDKLLSDFEQGNYVKVVSTTTYTVPSDTLKYHKTNSTSFIKKDRLEKMERKGEVEKE